jgi:hypothetical protein
MDTNIPPGTPSLLLELLEDVKSKPNEFPRNLHGDSHALKNVEAVVDAIPPRERSLPKDVAQQRLYDALYSIIKTEYDALEEDVEEGAKKDPVKAQKNKDLNRAIGLALEIAIRTASGKEPRAHPDRDALMRDLRDALREKVIVALKPKEA